MSKNVLINGETYNGVSTVALALATGGPALFRDADEASGGSINGIVEIATGSFSVSAASATAKIKPNMSIAPDVVVCIPRFWYDTNDNNGAIMAMSKYAPTATGRSAIDGATTHYIGNITEEADLSGEITLNMTTLAKFQPTYTDADGNTGTQEYLWVAVKFAE